MDEEEINRSSSVLKEPVIESSNREEEEDEDRDGNLKKIDERREVSSNNSSECTVDNNASIGGRGESRGSQLETLAASVPLSQSEFQFDESSQQLSEVPLEYSLQAAEGLKDKVRAIEGPSKGTSDQSTQLQIQHQIQLPDGPSRLELSKTPVTQSISSISNPALPEQKLQPLRKGNKRCPTEEEKQKYPGPKPISAMPMLKTPSDGYNWRKYGQKQVKSPEGFRSYYRCTFADCVAKKIECCDRYNRVTDTVYRSHHNHDPPRKMNCSRENRSAVPNAPVNGCSDIADPVKGLTDLGPSTSVQEPSLGMDQTPDTEQQKSNDSDETSEAYAKEEYVDGSESKKRQKKMSAGELGTLPKPGNKPKFVVHAAVDAGISGDGYRWRKYGQKMVKGNPHPRNYYRCTSAGCPVRKHIETAVDNTNTSVITYKGGHNHDMPVPRKRHSQKNATLASEDNSQTYKTTETHENQIERSVDKESDSTGKALNTTESTRTLLGIGFEIKPC